MYSTLPAANYFSRLCAFCSQYVSEQTRFGDCTGHNDVVKWENRCSLQKS